MGQNKDIHVGHNFELFFVIQASNFQCVERGLLEVAGAVGTNGGSAGPGADWSVVHRFVAPSGSDPVNCS